MDYKDRLHEIVREAIRDVIVETTLTEGNRFSISDYFDFSKITKEQLKKIDVDLSHIVRWNGYGSNIMLDEEQINFLSSRTTWSVDKVREDLKKSFGFEDWQIVVDSKANNVKIILLFVDKFENARLVISEMECCGWSYSCFDRKVVDGVELIGLSFDPKYIKSVSKEAREFKWLYHWTPLYNLENIRAEGLKPTIGRGFFHYPSHVHLMKGDLFERRVIDLGWQLCQRNKDIKESCSYVLLSIETDKVPSSVAFYYDPRYEGGYYTKRRIPPEAIRPIGEVLFRKEKTYYGNYKITYY